MTGKAFDRPADTSRRGTSRVRSRLGHAAIRPLLCGALLVVLALPASAAAPATEEDKALYALGLSIGRSLSVFQLSETELDIVKRGMTDHVTGGSVDPALQEYGAQVRDFARERRKALGKKQAGAGKDYLENAAKEKGAIRTPSGMVYTPLTEGTGASPKADDVVKVHYRGTLIDGKEFESSYKRGKPLEFRLDTVIKCWAEGVQKMKPGGKARLVCPPALAYGETGAGEQILPGATLAFEVELLEVNPVATPKPVRSAPEVHAAPVRR